MSKHVAITVAIAVAAIAATAAIVCLYPGHNAADAHFGRGRADPIIFLPAKSRLEERILRHPNADGSAADDVWMRDGTTKHIVYDRRMNLRQVSSYFKAPEGQERGPLQYEKTHDASGHLASERHLRSDGTLEMDGLFRPDGTYVRHLYYPAANQGQPAPVVSAEQTFDKWWHPVSETDFRPDSTRKLVHTWGDGLDETVKNYSDDGQILLNEVTTGRGKWYTAVYYPDGVNIKVEALNIYEGTIFQWYRPDHSLQLKLTFTMMHADELIIPDQTGKPQIRQVWYPDYNQKLVDGKYPLRLDHVDHFSDQGKVDIRYDLDTKTHKLTTITVYKGDETWGARVIYTVGADGWATSATTFDESNNTDGDKPLTHANGKHFVVAPGIFNHPDYELPPLKEGLNLYGLNRWFGR